jgi:hypothetical protein
MRTITQEQKLDHYDKLQAHADKVAAKWYLGSFWDQTADADLRMTARRAGGACSDQLAKALRRYMQGQFGMQG